MRPAPVYPCCNSDKVCEHKELLALKKNHAALLKALKVMVETISDEELDDHDLGQGHDTDSCGLCMAREAIVKAEGK